MNKDEILFTMADHSIIESYKYLLDGLGAFLGNGYELILHSLENLHCSVIHIVNGHLSGRKVGAPITDFALSMLDNIRKKGEVMPVTYFTRGKNNVPIKSCTIPIVGEGSKVIGLVCVNLYTDVPLHSFLNGFSSMFSMSEKDSFVIENFAENVDDLILETLNTIKAEVYADDAINTANKNKEIVNGLYEKGVFNIKDSVIKVAKLLNISKNTVYMHVRNNKDKGK